MSLSERVGAHMRHHVVGYVALFIALTGTSYAATQITSKQIAKNAVKAKHIKDGQVGTADVADNGLTGADIDEASLQNLPVLLADGSVTTVKLADAAVTLPKLADAAVNQAKLAFDPATQAELDALATAGTINAAGNPVDFSKLKNVPAGLADGTDDGGSAPGSNSLGAAEPPAGDDQIVDGSIDTQDLTDGSIADADIAAAAAIDDSKLGTINDAGKVADTALSSDIAQLSATQTFSGNNTFNGTSVLNGDVQAQPSTGENWTVSKTATATESTSTFLAALFNNTTAGAQQVAALLNGSGTGTTESILQLIQSDLDTAVLDGIDFDVAAGAIDTALNASDPEILTALDIGANAIETSTATISSTELERLDGTISRTVSLPLGSFMNLSALAPIDFGFSDGTAPDFALNDNGLVIEYDDNVNGGDSGFIGTTLAVPEDYSSGSGFSFQVSKDLDTAGVAEQLTCQMGINGAAMGSTASTTITGAGNQRIVVTPGGSPAAGDSIALRCRAGDPGNTGVQNDFVRIHAAAFEYSATR